MLGYFQCYFCLVQPWIRIINARIAFADKSYRLLGLFRLWNAMKYFFPHHDIIDMPWNDLLIEFIPKMLEDTTMVSYQATLMAMAHYLHDGHVRFEGENFFAQRFGRYLIPARLAVAEGELIVYQIIGNHNPLERGDVLVALNGRDVHEIAAEMLPYISFPTDEKALYLMARGTSLRANSRQMELDILRNGVPLTVSAHGSSTGVARPLPNQSHELMTIDGYSIGLINPSVSYDTHRIMAEFADTDGIIIDLRRPAAMNFFLSMRQYLMPEPIPFAYISSPLPTHPGIRGDNLVNQFLPPSPYAFIYDRPVVILVDVSTASQPEWLTMGLRVASNVTVIGSQTMGANGNIGRLPLPGWLTMVFTSLGVYTYEGGQTFRIGLEPDIRVDRTIQGIAEGRDEILEAAIEFILGN